MLKFRGAGQVTKALVAELAAGEIGRALGLPVPEIVLVELDPDLGRTKPRPGDPGPDPGERQGLNLALDYLPGAVMFDPLAERPDAELTSAIVWFDAYLTNIDRTARNANMLVWDRHLHLIDHGAALYFHHAGGDYLARAAEPFPMIQQVPRPAAARRHIAGCPPRLAPHLTADEIERIVGLLPDDWLAEDGGPAPRRAAYAGYLQRRLEAPRPFVEEAIRARSL